MKQLSTAVALKALKDQGLGNEEIVALVKDEGWERVRLLAEKGGK